MSGVQEREGGCQPQEAAASEKRGHDAPLSEKPRSEIALPDAPMSSPSTVRRRMCPRRIVARRCTARG